MRNVMVYVYGFRHGKALTGAKGDKLLPEGVRQVFKSTVNNLMEISFQAFFSSMRHRALQTARYIALAVTGKENDIHPRMGLDYSDTLIEECGGGEAMNNAAKNRAAERGSTVITIQDWMDIAPLWTGTMREQISQELRAIATEEAVKSDQAEIHLLIANHSPVIDTAAVNMAAMPRLQEADIIKYTIGVALGAQSNFTEILASEYVPRGF